MIDAEVQIHGYRRGHQLLASSVLLSKDDQVLVDRLSDVAGPIRPKEEFTPYLTVYPLPSGKYIVIARTWQDLTVPRAGCVRTKSIFVDAETWGLRPPIFSILRLLDSAKLPADIDAVHLKLDEQDEAELPIAANFSKSELLEALFLEDPKPVVVFGAPDPELIAVRLLTAMWPTIRSRFSLSTFALSPRRIGGRDFDLIFAPLSARSRFSDWAGRRVDGRASSDMRHRWTSVIARRVFDVPSPELLSNDEITMLSEQTTGDTSALRVALLWEELVSSLSMAPTAALGLLDIANSGKVKRAAAVKLLEPLLAQAVRRASDLLAPNDAWDFVSAITRKMQRYELPAGWDAVEKLVTQLAERAPEGAVSLMSLPVLDDTLKDLLPKIAAGLGRGEAPQVEQLLINAPSIALARLASQGGMLCRRIAENDELINRMGDVLRKVDLDLASRSGKNILPYIIEDRQLPIAKPIFERLNAETVASELQRLGGVNGFEGKLLTQTLINHARQINGLSAARKVLVSSNPSTRRDALIEMTLEPTKLDVLWLLNEKRLSETTSVDLLIKLLRRSNDRQLNDMLSEPEIYKRVVPQLSRDAKDILTRALIDDGLPLNLYMPIFHSAISLVNEEQKLEIAERALDRCLCSKFDGDEIGTLLLLIGILRDSLDFGKAVMTALEYGVSAETASRNLVTFAKAPLEIRKNFVAAIDKVAFALRTRNEFDLTEEAYDACADLMIDAEKISNTALVEAAGELLQPLLRARAQPVSQMIATLFPIVYSALGKAEEIPPLLAFFAFFDWDRCKVARSELVAAFMSSNWRAGDLALTACRSNDVAKILKRVYCAPAGNEYLARVESDLGRLDSESRRLVRSAIAEIRLANSLNP